MEKYETFIAFTRFETSYHFLSPHFHGTRNFFFQTTGRHQERGNAAADDVAEACSSREGEK